jgi:hypothetical protein
MKLPQLRNIALIVGVLALALDIGLAGFTDSRTWSAAWLVATLFWGGLSLGALAILMTHELTGGRWGEPLGPGLKAACAALVLFALVLLALLFKLPSLFSWTLPAEQLPEVVRRKTLYLNQPFFIVRTLIYLGIWLTLAWRLGAWRPTGASHTRLSAGGLVLWLLTVTFFSFDWLMSLEPRWYSDIFGLVYGAGILIPAAGLVMLTIRQSAPAATSLNQARYDFANLWLAPLMGWAFLAFSQYLIIWEANLPDEIGWFLHRTQGAWRGLAWAVALTLFAIPTALLFSPRLKRSVRGLTLVAVMTLLGHGLNCYWLVQPTLRPHAVHPGFSDMLAWLAVGGLWIAIFLHELTRQRSHHEST